MAAGTKATASITAAAERYTRLIFLHGRGTPPPDEYEGTKLQPALSGCTISVTNETEVCRCYVCLARPLSVLHARRLSVAVHFRSARS